MSSTKIDASSITAVHNNVKEYYGKALSGTVDLKTNVCMMGNAVISKHIQEALKLVHESVTSKYYGCGTVIPECLEETQVLDLGSGTGRDCYVLSKLVGEKGGVTGIDMTDEQLAIANKYIDYHTELYGYSKPNVRFVKGYIEQLAEAGLEQDSFDMVVSNCVVNLTPDKRAVLTEAYRVLKVGGEMYFCDVYADRRLSEEIRQHKLLWGECVAGALWWEDLLMLVKEIGFSTPLTVTAYTHSIGDKELEDFLGEARFASVTYRLFKPPPTPEAPCNVIYQGSVTGFEDSLTLDHYNTFKTGDVVTVDSEVATILKTSRFCSDFTFQPCGDGTCFPTKEHEMNPFKIAAESGSSVTCGSSCGPTQSAEASCKPKPSGDGCCPPKSSGGCC